MTVKFFFAQTINILDRNHFKNLDFTVIRQHATKDNSKLKTTRNKRQLAKHTDAVASSIADLRTKGRNLY